MVSKHRNNKRFRVEIDARRCKECDLCIDFCNRGVFESDLGRPVLVHEENCNGCQICELICPDFAINLEAVSL